MQLLKAIGLLREIPLVAGSLLARSRIGISFYLRIYAEGKDILPPFPLIVCSNHSSHLDYIALVEALGLTHNDVIAVAAADFYFDGSLRGRLIQKLFNLAPIHRGASPSSLRRCAELCAEFVENGGKVVLIYPEGTRTADGHIQPFKHGFVRIVERLGLPVVPAFIEGTFRLLSRHDVFPKPGIISVRFGEAISVGLPPADGVVDRLSATGLKDFALGLEQRIRTLSKQSSHVMHDESSCAPPKCGDD